jgi:hypothetical protein
MYAESSGIKPLTKTRFRSELRAYFDDYKAEVEIDNKWVRHAYIGFKTKKFVSTTVKKKEKEKLETWLDLKEVQ